MKTSISHFCVTVVAAMLLPMAAASAAPASSTFDEVYVGSGSAYGGLASVNVSYALEDASFIRQVGADNLEQLRASFEQNLATSIVQSDATISLSVVITEIIPNVIHRQGNPRLTRFHRGAGIGHVAMEATFREIATGQVVLRVRDERHGPDYYRDLELVSRDTWGDASDILDDWAEELPQAF